MTIERSYRKFDCLDCGKTVREPRGFKGFNIADSEKTNVEIEYYDYCKKCGDRRLRENKQQARLTNLLQTDLIEVDLIQKYLKGEVSKKNFWEYVNRKEAEQRKARLSVVKKHSSPSKLKRLEKRKLEREFSSFDGQCKIARGY